MKSVAESAIDAPTGLKESRPYSCFGLASISHLLSFVVVAVAITRVASHFTRWFIFTARDLPLFPFAGLVSMALPLRHQPVSRPEGLGP